MTLCSCKSRTFSQLLGVTTLKTKYVLTYEANMSTVHDINILNKYIYTFFNTNVNIPKNHYCLSSNYLTNGFFLGIMV